MKNRKLPTSKQFDRIVENAFSSDVKHNFSVDYEIRKEAIQRGTSMKKRNRTIQWKSIGITAAAAAIVAVAPVIDTPDVKEQFTVRPCGSSLKRKAKFHKLLNL